MSVIVNDTCIVYPAEKTPCRTIWLSRLDMYLRQPYSHTRVIYVYHPNNTKIDTTSSTFFDVNVMKKSLSKALVPYYPLAGRLKINDNNGRYEINCNENGVLFIEAETTHTLSDLGDEFTPNYELRKELVHPDCDYSKGISSFPLLIVQVTRFKCGGVTVGVATHHHVADGFAHTQFINSWANLARGVDPSVTPCYDRAPFLAPRDPPQVNFKHLEFEPPLPPVLPKTLSGETPTTIEEIFKLSEDQANALKLVAKSPDVISKYKPSTFQVIAAHLWRSVCKARGLADDQDVKLYINIDGRSRLKDPSLPPGYFGNAIFFSCCVAKAGDLIRNPLWCTVGKIDEAVKRMDNEYLRSAVDYIESRSDLTDVLRGPQYVTCPSFQVNSFAKLPISEADFGWGGPENLGPGGLSEGQSKIISSLTEDKSLYVAIKLFKSHMDLFRKCFYEF